MIQAKSLTKRYSGRTAVDRISFEVEKGEIVGFLGPNGAGKSTTLRMLTCFLSASDGTATVAGFDIARDSLKVRQVIGYMPENVPLYPEMRVREYLCFRARLKGMRYRESISAVAEAMDTCSLQGVERKMIGTLSKGYRQRVGLADALVHKPELLILDEPTNGLDPSQIRQARDLVKELGEKHTILISTHILNEVEMTCNRVIIINQGKIKASDSPSTLIRRLHRPGQVSLEAIADSGALGKLRTIPGVSEVTSSETDDGWTRFQLTSNAECDVREPVFALATECGWRVRQLEMRRPSLEDAFVDLLTNEQSETASAD